MSAQINLYHPRFLRQRDGLKFRNVAVAAGLAYGALSLSAGWAWVSVSKRSEAAAAAERELKAARDVVAAETKRSTARQVSPQLKSDIERAEAMLQRRAEIARVLESGSLGSQAGFAEHLRGLARQVPEGLWLTGISIGAGGGEMEIRGSMLTASALPDYIRRLGTEKAFQGRSFATLTMNRGEVASGGQAAVPAVAAAPVATAAIPVAATATASGSLRPTARPIDFVLTPRVADSKEPRQ